MFWPMCITNQAIKSDTISATAGSYVEYDDPYSSVEWILDVDIGGTYLVSFRYALDSAPTPLSIFVNSVDATQDILFYPTGGWTDDWLYSNPLEVNLTAGQNTIQTQVSDSFNSGPNIDHIKIEGITVTSTPLSSFRNPPHFMSLIPDYAPYGTGEQNVRDAQYETDAVLDHYFHHDNGEEYPLS